MITFSFRRTISVYERHTVNKNNKRSSIIITVAILVTICIAAFLSGILPSILQKGQSPNESIYSSEKESFSRRESEPDTKATAEPLTSAETKDTEPATESRESLPDETDDALLREPVFKPGYAFIYDFPAKSESDDGSSDTYPSSPEQPSSQESTDDSEIPEYSDNSAFIGRWILEYDLTKAQEEAVLARFGVSLKPSEPILLRISAELYENETLRLFYAEADQIRFRNALNAWYSDAAALYGKSGAGALQRAAFASWAAYRKGLYALLSPGTLNNLSFFWNVLDDSFRIADTYGTIQAELGYQFEDDTHLTVTTIHLTDPSYQSTADALQAQLGFAPPYYLIKE